MSSSNGKGTQVIRRLDHLICEVPDIENAVKRFVEIGFPLAWPVGRFWAQGRTAGIAVGGINLEFLQPDQGAPNEARIRTLVFEPVDLEVACQRLQDIGFPMQTIEKWESNPDLLRLRGFNAQESKTPQLICTNAYPSGDIPIDFFLCKYSRALGQRLTPSSFPNVKPVQRVVLSTPRPTVDRVRIRRLLRLLESDENPQILVSEAPSQFSEVTEILLDRGAVDLIGWPARFRFT